MRSLDLTRYISPQESFSIRVARYGGISKEVSRVKLEAELGGVMLSQIAARVDLENPIRRFRGMLAGPYFHFGLQTFKRPRGSVARRRPRKRPAFHPSTMVPKLARCLVNLACATEETVFWTRSVASVASCSKPASWDAQFWVLMHYGGW